MSPEVEVHIKDYDHWALMSSDLESRWAQKIIFEEFNDRGKQDVTVTLINTGIKVIDELSTKKPT